jgi:hypothetical protein
MDIGTPHGPRLSGRYANLPVAAAIGLLMATPFLGEWPLWPSLAAMVLAGTLAVPFVCR